MKKRILLGLFLAIGSSASLFLYAVNAQTDSIGRNGIMLVATAVQKAPEYAPMAGPGKKIPIDNDYYFIYEFDKKPKLGTVILKVEIFDKDGKRDTAFEVKADAGMPSMKGAHETGDRSLVLSKKGDYLIPIPIVMPGVWEIRLTILKRSEAVFRGSYQFDV